MFPKNLKVYSQDFERIDFYKIFTYFFSCAFIGWIFETLVVYFQSGKMTDRGLLFVGKEFNPYFSFLNNIPYIKDFPLAWGLPLIEIYGFGGLMVLLLLGRYKHKVVQLFLIGTLLMTLLELGSSYFCTEVLHQSFWDYSKEFMNFHGRICLRSSITWGVLTIFSIKVLKPRLDEMYKKEENVKLFKRIIRGLTIYTIICLMFKFFVFEI